MKTVLAILLWTLAVIGGFVAYAFWFWHPDVPEIEAHLVQRLRSAEQRRAIGSAALVLMKRGQIVAEHRFGSGTHVYQLASVSKAVTAFGVMRLVQEGRIGLDEPVMRYLKRWRFPGSEPYRDRVTVRHLLSHTAGFDDGLGYGGFAPDEPVQTLEESLNDARDSNVGRPRPARLTREPGTALAYSGAGYTLLQLLIEDVTGESFNAYMKRAVLQPWGMTTATFDWNELRQPPTAYDADVKLAVPRRHTALAAVSLYATPRDMGQLLRAVVKDSALPQMMAPQPGTSGTWGLGLTLYGGGIVGHDGGSVPAWGAMMRVNPKTGNGMALLVSGGRGAVNLLGHDWVYAETGVVTATARRQVLYDSAVPASITIVLGAIAIIAARR